MNLVERVKGMIVSPTREWSAISAEAHSVASLYTQYVMILAAIPAVASFIGYSVVGYSGLGTTYRVPIAAGVASTVLTYVLQLGSVYVMALVIDALAPNFGGEKNFTQALKVAAFFPTAYWVAGAFYIIPALAIFAIAGAVYTLWLLYTGLAPLMSVREDRAPGFTAAVLLVAIVLMLMIAVVAALLIPSPSRGF